MEFTSDSKAHERERERESTRTRLRLSRTAYIFGFFCCCAVPPLSSVDTLFVVYYGPKAVYVRQFSVSKKAAFTIYIYIYTFEKSSRPPLQLNFLPVLVIVIIVTITVRKRHSLRYNCRAHEIYRIAARSPLPLRYLYTHSTQSSSSPMLNVMTRLSAIIRAQRI